MLPRRQWETWGRSAWQQCRMGAEAGAGLGRQVTFLVHCLTVLISSEITMSTHLRHGSRIFFTCFFTMVSKAMSGVKSPVLNTQSGRRTVSQASSRQECQARALPHSPELCPPGPPTTPLWASLCLSVKWAGGILKKDVQLMFFGTRQGLLLTAFKSCFLLSFSSYKRFYGLKTAELGSLKEPFQE